MSKEIFIAYYSGEEPTGPGQSPTLDKTPDYVDIVPLFYIPVDAKGNLDFSRLTLHNSQSQLMAWMEQIRKRQAGTVYHTRFTLAFISSDFPALDPGSFAQTVKNAVDDWGADGVTIDYEPPSSQTSIVAVVQAIRDAIGPDKVMTAPIYSPWSYMPKLLHDFAAPFDYIETMDYTPYPGEVQTLSLYNSYAQAIGTPGNPAYEKVVIGVSCMEPPYNFTPLTDVVSLCKYEPSGGAKGGIMLYTLSYDVRSHGSGYPDGTFTKTIHDNLP